MTIEEAIKHCEEKAEELKQKAEEEYFPIVEDKEKADCLECAHEHEQLAEWLEELVELRSQRSSDFQWCKGCKEHDEENHCCHRLSNFIHTQAQEIHDMAYEEGKYDRPTGKWEEPFEWHDKTYHKCTNCHISSQLILIDNYCHYCGAKMKGGAEE